ncbi:MAG: DNA repair protein RecN [Burkholderiales bacterium]|nr:DNA repair protein RecN [Burkholderiales bacterium]
MLRALALREVVIVERADLEPAPGFTALTGETGAGKSILIDALELLVGARADAALVREGAERAELAAEFEVGGAALAQLLAEAGLEGDPGVVLLRRTIDRAGRSRCFVNGQPATLAQLRAVGEHLLDIHGQHEHQSLLRPAAQRDLLDARAGAQALAAECAAAWRECVRLEALAAEAAAEAARREAERRELEQAAAELGRLAPKEGEWEALCARQRALAHGATLLAGAQAALEALAESDGACLAQLRAAAARLRSLAPQDARLAPIVELLASAEAEAGEAVRMLRDYAARVELDPQALAETERRIEAWHAAARRHRVRPEALPGCAADLARRLEALEAAASPEALERELAAARRRYEAAARALSERRRAAAQAFSREVTAAMQALAMRGGRFAATVQPLAHPGPQGLEEIAFEVSSHPSLPLRPLAKVASGGELARISLAIHLVAAKDAPVGTLVFDEVDAGIGGAVAETVGRALKTLGSSRQVLCVTHLAQVAAQADEQWTVVRSNARGRVSVRLSRLDRAGRIEELARMLGGADITATQRRHAAELLGDG